MHDETQRAQRDSNERHIQTYLQILQLVHRLLIPRHRAAFASKDQVVVVPISVVAGSWSA